LFIINAPVEKVIELDNNIFLLKIHCPQISTIIKPGQFLNIRVSETIYPLLRRPFSVCDVEGEYFYIMFNVLGEGTKILAEKHLGDTIDVLGPLGNGFNFTGSYDTAIIVGGGLGAAPFPYLIRAIGNQKKVYSFIGGKTYKDVITHGIKNISIATDDGSLGFKGTVVDLLKDNLDLLNSGNIKIFACGPNAMLRTLKEFSINNNFECEVSTECAMACGFGICQGCPIESTEKSDKYLLVCKDGPVFNVKDVVI
jgi:dihydroorotate dehydrogenase electron transfer subunit